MERTEKVHLVAIRHVRDGLGMSLTLLKGNPLRVTDVKGTGVRQEREARSVQHGERGCAIR